MNRFKEDFIKEIEIPEQLESVINNSMKMVKKEKRLNLMKKITLTCCVTMLITVGVFGLARTYPAQASKIPVLGYIFDRINNTTYYKVDVTNTENLVIKESEFASDSDVTITIPEINYDINSIFLGINVQSEKSFKKGLKTDNSYDTINLVDTVIIKDKEGNYITQTMCPGIQGTYVDENTFVGIAEIDLRSLIYYPTPEEINAAGLDINDYKVKGEFSSEAYFEDIKKLFPNAGKRIEIPDVITCELQINEMFVVDPENPDNRIYYKGNWSFVFDIINDGTNTQTVEINELDNEGYGILSVNKNKMSITVDTSLPGLGFDYFVVVCDADGDLLNFQGEGVEKFSIVGRDTSKVYVFVCDYNEYMSNKKYYWSDDYEIKKKEKTFAQYLSEFAKYQATVDFE